jgi:phosphotriesterase-related protein
MYLYTTLGLKSSAELGMILPHEHIFVDLRTWDQPGYAQAEIEAVMRLMVPELEKARAAGVTALVECTPLGVGRRADILKAVSEAADFPLVLPTGIYREPWVPPWAHAASQKELSEWMQGELQGQIEGSGVRAGFIKLSASDEGLTLTEAKILRAAAGAALATGAAIGSHTIRGRVVSDQLDILDSCGFPSNRFIWIHAQAEANEALNFEMARRGAWIEYDSIGEDASDLLIFSRVLHMLEAGRGEQILLSHDRGWYDPAQPDGGTPRPFTPLCEQFLPRLRAAGVDAATIQLLTCENPFRAFARKL